VFVDVTTFIQGIFHQLALCHFFNALGHLFHFSTLLGLTDFVDSLEGAGNPLLRLLATVPVASVCLWQEECPPANTILRPNRR
jgi:hypothetical protein